MDKTVTCKRAPLYHNLPGNVILAVNLRLGLAHSAEPVRKTSVGRTERASAHKHACHTHSPCVVHYQHRKHPASSNFSCLCLTRKLLLPSCSSSGNPAKCHLWHNAYHNSFAGHINTENLPKPHLTRRSSVHATAYRTHKEQG
jgi:hypothetical protein